MYILQGMGGLGKAEMARHSAMSMRQKRYVFWIDCRSLDTMVSGVKEMKASLAPIGAGDVEATPVKTLLAERLGWFLIFDNVDGEKQLEYIRNELLPSPNPGQILVTGRLTSISTLSPNHTLQMPLMEESEATALLNRLRLTDSDPTGTECLVKTLGYLPLAIEQAGFYMLEGQHAITEYLQLYKTGEMRRYLLDYKPGFDSGSYRPVLRTFDISFDDASKKSQRLLYIVAF